MKEGGTVLKIAICDDDKEHRDVAQRMAMEYAAAKNVQYEVDAFGVSSELLDTVERGVVYDIYLMDIYMPGVTGMSISTELRSRDVQSPIIFLTSSADHALEAFGVSATHYLLKPYTRDQFFLAMDKAMQSITVHTNRTIVVKVDNTYRSLLTNEIYFCKAENKYQRIYLTSGEDLLVRITAGELYQMLEESGCFCHCGRAHIINLNWLSKVTANSAIMKNGEQLSLSHSAVAALRTAFFKYFD